MYFINAAPLKETLKPVKQYKFQSLVSGVYNCLWDAFDGWLV